MGEHLLHVQLSRLCVGDRVLFLLSFIRPDLFLVPLPTKDLRRQTLTILSLTEVG